MSVRKAGLPPLFPKPQFMAKKWTNENLPGALHFITGNVLDRKPIFKKDRNCIAFLEELQSLRTKYECKLVSFVIMPDHFHLTLNPRDGDIQKHTGIFKEPLCETISRACPTRLFWRWRRESGLAGKFQGTSALVELDDQPEDKLHSFKSSSCETR